MCLGDSPEIAAWYMDASADDFSPPFAGAGETGGTPDFFAILAETSYFIVGLLSLIHI